MAKYAERNRMVVVKGYKSYVLTNILSDLGVEYSTNQATESETTAIVFKATLPLYDHLHRIAERNDLVCIWFDRMYL